MDWENELRSDGTAVERDKLLKLGRERLERQKRRAASPHPSPGLATNVSGTPLVSSGGSTTNSKLKEYNISQLTPISPTNTTCVEPNPNLQNSTPNSSNLAPASGNHQSMPTTPKMPESNISHPTSQSKFTDSNLLYTHFSSQAPSGEKLPVLLHKHTHSNSGDLSTSSSVNSIPSPLLEPNNLSSQASAPTSQAIAPSVDCDLSTAQLQLEKLKSENIALLKLLEDERLLNNELNEQMEELQRQIVASESPLIAERDISLVKHSQRLSAGDLEQPASETRSLIAELQQQVRYYKESSTQVNALQSQISQLAESSQTQREKYELEIGELLQRCQALDALALDRSRLLTQSISNTNNMMAEIQAKDSTISNLESKLQSVSEELEEVKIKNSGLNNKVFELEGLLDGISHDKSDAEKQLRQFQLHIQALQSSSSMQLQVELDRGDSQRDYISMLEQEKSALIAELQEMQQQLLDAQSAATSFQLQLNQQQQTHSEELRKVLLCNEDLETEMQMLRAGSNASIEDRSQENVSELLAQISELEAQLSRSSESEQRKLKSNEIEITRLESELDSNRQSYTETQIQLQNSLLRNEELNTFVVSMRTELERLNLDLSETRRTEQQHLATIQELKSQLNACESNLVQLKLDNERRSQILANIKGTTAEERLKVLEHSYSNVVAENERLTIQIQNRSTAKLETTIELLQRECADLGRQLESQQRVAEKLMVEQEDAVDLHNSLTAAQQQIEYLIREKADLQMRLFTKTEELDSLERAISPSGSELDPSALTVPILLQRLSEAEKALIQFRIVASEQRDQLQKLRSEALEDYKEDLNSISTVENSSPLPPLSQDPNTPSRWAVRQFWSTVLGYD